MHNHVFVKVTRENVEKNTFDLNITDHIQLLGNIMANKKIVKIVDSMSGGFLSAVRKFNSFDIKTRNIFDVGSAVVIKEGFLFDTEHKSLKQSLEGNAKIFENNDLLQGIEICWLIFEFKLLLLSHSKLSIEVTYKILLLIHKVNFMTVEFT